MGTMRKEHIIIIIMGVLKNEMPTILLARSEHFMFFKMPTLHKV
jgi:hypothetical protein